MFYGVVTNATQTTRPDAPSVPGPQRWVYWTLPLKIKVQDGMIRLIFAFFRGKRQPNSGWPDVPAK